MNALSSDMRKALTSPLSSARSLSTSERASSMPIDSSTCAVVDLLFGMPWLSERQ